MYGNALVQFKSSVGVQRSGTGSQMKRGLGHPGLRAFRRRRTAVTRSMQRVAEHIRWKDLENKRVGVRACSSRRSLGVVYLKARFSEES